MEKNVPTEEPLLPQATKARAVKRQSRTNEILKQRAEDLEGNDYRRQKHMDAVAFNAGAESAFVELVRGLIEKSPGGKMIPIVQVFQEGAYEIGVSTQTAKRYLIKHSAQRAEFRVFGDYVMLNPNYEPVRGRK